MQSHSVYSHHESNGAPRGAPLIRDALPASNADAFLGTTAKFQATSHTKGFQPLGVSEINLETGEIQTLGASGLPMRDAAECRLERYALQSVVRDLLPNSRTAKCLHWLAHNSSGVNVWKSTKHQRAHYTGLQTCASVWACPVCTAKISERRRVELQSLITSHEAAGGYVVLLTRTFPHQRTDSLPDLLKQLSKADSGYKSHRNYKTLIKSVGLVGSVKAVEVTYGSNGWHPHVHELLFLTKPIDLHELEEGLFTIWQGAALRAGFDAPSRAHGLQLQDGSKAAKYASKWGLESELTQWHRKRGKVESRTPFDLLRQVFATKDKHASVLFREYAEAFHGRHQLQFSRGLKKLYAITEYTDDELSKKIDDDAVLLCTLKPGQWRLVVKTRQRGSLLEVASALGKQGIDDFLINLDRNRKRLKQHHDH